MDEQIYEREMEGIQYAAGEIKALREVLADRAAELVKEFHERRNALQDDVERAQAARGNPGKSRRGTYAPLNLMWRMVGDSLELKWVTISFTRRGKKIYRHVKIGKGATKHDMGTLLRLAKYWERTLVKETESAAAELRERRNAITALLRDLATLERATTRYQNRSFYSGTAVGVPAVPPAPQPISPEIPRERTARIAPAPPPDPDEWIP